MRAVSRILCLLGHHDWHIHDEDPWLSEWLFAPPAHGEFPATWWGTCCLIPTILIMIVVGIWCFTTARSPVSFTLLGVAFTLLWITSFMLRKRNRRDARCVVCGKQTMEASRYKERVSKTKMFFKHYDEAKQDYGDEDEK